MRPFIIVFVFCVILFDWFLNFYAIFLLKKNNKILSYIPFIEQMKAVCSLVKGNTYRYCKYFYPIPKSNRVFFQVYICWYRFKVILTLAAFLVFFLAILMFPLIVLWRKYM